MNEIIAIENVRKIEKGVQTKHFQIIVPYGGRNPLDKQSRGGEAFNEKEFESLKKELLTQTQKRGVLPEDAPPENDGRLGHVICADGQFTFEARQIVIIPPAVRYHLVCPFCDTLRITLNSATVPYKNVAVLNDLKGEHVHIAAFQAGEFFFGGYAKKDAVLAAMGSVLASLTTVIYGEDRQTSPVSAQIVREIKNRISDSGFCLEDYMKNLPLSYDYMRKLFKKETGASPHDYLVNARMERAAALLLSGQTNRFSNFSVSQIAEACGYADVSYFSKTFKKYFGTSPKEYAERQSEK